MTGKELRELRDDHGISRKTLAIMLGYTTNYIARLERGWENEKPLLITRRCEIAIKSFFSGKKKKSS